MFEKGKDIWGKDDKVKLKRCFRVIFGIYEVRKLLILVNWLFKLEIGKNL